MSEINLAPGDDRPIDSTDPFDSVGNAAGPVWFDRTVRWLRAHDRLLLAVAIAFQLTVLLAMIVLHAAPYLVGKTILLNVVPVDPRDLFRGDYVVLSYDLNRVPAEGVKGLPEASNQWWRARQFSQEELLNDRSVYVTLELDADGKHWHGTQASTHPPESGLYIRGKYVPGRFQGPLVFGIEACFVEEGQGREWETARNARQLSAEIAVAPGARPNSAGW